MKRFTYNPQTRKTQQLEDADAQVEDADLRVVECKGEEAEFHTDAIIAFSMLKNDQYEVLGRSYLCCKHTVEC